MLFKLKIGKMGILKDKIFYLFLFTETGIDSFDNVFCKFLVLQIIQIFHHDLDRGKNHRRVDMRESWRDPFNNSAKKKINFSL